MRRLKDVGYTRLLRSDFAAFGSGSTLTPSMFIAEPHNIEVGARVRFDPLSVLSARSTGGAAPRIVIGDDVEVGGLSRILALGGATLTIGERSILAGGTSILAGCDIQIGRGALLGWNVAIGDFRHLSGRRDMLIRDQGLGGYSPIRVGDGAWIGANAGVIPGVTIGENAIVGANALVTKDVPPGVTVGGVPAVPLSGH
jgi:acetyltransferase-like isoleucine patch superfamily enzyme